MMIRGTSTLTILQRSFKNPLQYFRRSMTVLKCNTCKPPDHPIIATSNIFCCNSHDLAQFQLIHLNERFIHRSHLSRDKDIKEHGHLKVIPNKSLLPLISASIIIRSNCSTAPVIKQLEKLIRKHRSAVSRRCRNTMSLPMYCRDLPAAIPGL